MKSCWINLRVKTCSCPFWLFLKAHHGTSTPLCYKFLTNLGNPHRKWCPRSLSPSHVSPKLVFVCWYRQPTFTDTIPTSSFPHTCSSALGKNSNLPYLQRNPTQVLGFSIWILPASIFIWQRWDLLETMVVSEELIRSEKLLLQMMEKPGWAFVLDMGITHITCKISTAKIKLGDFKLAGLLETGIF